MTLDPVDWTSAKAAAHAAEVRHLMQDNALRRAVLHRPTPTKPAASGRKRKAEGGPRPAGTYRAARRNAAFRRPAHGNSRPQDRGGPTVPTSAISSPTTPSSDPGQLPPQTAGKAVAAGLAGGITTVLVWFFGDRFGLEKPAAGDFVNALQYLLETGIAFVVGAIGPAVAAYMKRNFPKSTVAVLLCVMVLAGCSIAPAGGTIPVGPVVVTVDPIEQRCGKWQAIADGLTTFGFKHPLIGLAEAILTGYCLHNTMPPAPTDDIQAIPSDTLQELRELQADDGGAVITE